MVNRQRVYEKQRKVRHPATAPGRRHGHGDGWFSGEENRFSRTKTLSLFCDDITPFLDSAGKKTPFKNNPVAMLFYQPGTQFVKRRTIGDRNQCMTGMVLPVCRHRSDDPIPVRRRDVAHNKGYPKRLGKEVGKFSSLDARESYALSIYFLYWKTTVQETPVFSYYRRRVIGILDERRRTS